MQPTKILIIQNKRIGDVLIASILANNLKHHLPNSHITFFAYDYTIGVLEHNPNIDRIIVANDSELKKLPVLWKTIRDIRKERYDVILDPYAKFQSKIMCLFSGVPKRIGFKRKGKKHKFPFYTNPVDFLDTPSLPCGKALEDRVNMLRSNFDINEVDPKYRIFLSPEEETYNRITHLKRPVIMLGVLGSTPNKSLPYEYIAEIIDYLARNYQASFLFNYAPHQRKEAEKIFGMCRHKEQIHLDIYEDSIRGFIRLMNQCDLLISNEGGSVHIAKALNKPTFTIYSPYIKKSDWNSFEDGLFHDSIHLFDEDPDYFERLTRDEKKEIEASPERLYRKLTPEKIINKLRPYLDQRLKKQE